MVGRLESVLLKHPKDAFISQERIAKHWPVPGWEKDLGPPDYSIAIEEYDFFVDLLNKHIPRIEYLPRSSQTGIDSIYTHDPIVIVQQGAILCNMRNWKRQNEPVAAGDFVSKLGIPVVGSIKGEGTLEGGDLVWIDRETLAVGRGYRTNDEGIRQLKAILGETIRELVVVQLPHWLGPDNCLHLMSLISPVDDNLAVVYSKLMSVSFHEMLIRRRIKLIEVPDVEYETLGCNILTIAPRKCVMLAGNPLTKKRLEDEGVEVWEFKGHEICTKGEGGPTCMTSPILRS